MGTSGNFNYIIRLTPVGTYFLGGEITFGEGDGKQNYYVRSNKLPQVSTLLGVVRYEVLRQNNLLGNNKKNENDIRKAIGEKGFDMSRNLDYGIIQKISPLFIENKSKNIYYTPLPLDYGIDVVKNENISCSAFSGSKFNYAMKAENYDPKNYDNFRYWIGTDKGKIKDEDIFYTKEQIGITKEGREINDNEAFYKLVTVGLKPEYNFVFLLTTSEKLNDYSGMVYMGGNRSVFKMDLFCLNPKGKDSNNTDSNETECNENENYFCDKFKFLRKKGRFLLLGDAFLENEKLSNIPFFWAQSICNRYIVTKYNEKVSWGKPKKTKQLFRLLGRGGVIYSEEKPSCDEYLTKVGLNIFI